MDWIKIFTRKWLFGSGRMMSPEKRGVWADLLALAAETKLRDGSLRFDVGQPMSRDYISGILMIPRDLLDTCIIAFQADINLNDGKPRVQIWDDGTIFLTNFSEYQEVPDGKKSPDKMDARDRELWEREQTRKFVKRRPDEAMDVLQEDINKMIQHADEKTK